MEQERSVFDKETLLDLTVNVIPLGIMLFFFILFIPSVYGPWPWESTYSLLQIALIVIPFIGLAVLTYFSAKAIEGDAIKSGSKGHADSPERPAAGEKASDEDEQVATAE
ncbi:DUF6684 family protein [Haloarchaeobius sp. TZWWS8]|uniref:DUF6684 family protein n=1 Tax=Haloarchaeobius sp. TZWWS8 TaxID=3446121 RepID=UPI003EB9F3E3